MKKTYYIIMQRGVPVDVQSAWPAAVASRDQYTTVSHEASIVPVQPVEFTEEEKTDPGGQLSFDFSDVEIGGEAGPTGVVTGAPECTCQECKFHAR